MFERYTENARRALFFARYEASQFGDIAIKAEHLLLGLTRCTAGTAARLLGDRGISDDDIRRQIQEHVQFRDKVSTSVEIPFDSETKRILSHAAEEADSLSHRHIGTEHLLLGMLRDEQSETTKMLTECGVRYAAVRDDVEKLVGDGKSYGASPGEISALMDGLTSLLDRLGTVTSDKTDVQPLLDEIRERVRQLRRQLHQP